LPRQWQHFLIAPDLPLVDAPGQLAMATLLTHRPVACALLVGEHPEWLTALVGRHSVRAWQVAQGDASGTITREGHLSRIHAPIAEALPLLLDELRDNEIDIDLIIWGRSE
jgi:hypothetical protein